MSKDTQPAPAFSRPLSLTEVPPEGLDIEIVASQAECAALAELNAIPAVIALSARLRARRWRGEGLEITGELRARVLQNCVVTLEDFESDIVEPIEVRFAPPKEPARPRSRRGQPEPEPIVADILGDDPPDELMGESVDLGGVAGEFLTLALDPYPRKPDAQFAEPAPSSENETVSPFSRLKTAGDSEPSAGK